MKYSAARTGRVFVVRLEHGDIIHETIESIARKENVMAASVTAVGGVDAGSVFIVGPADGRAVPVQPMEHMLTEAHEVCGTGTIFPNETGEPVLHMHLSAGRKEETVTGCVRKGVKVWQVLEVVLHEIVDTPARRVKEMPLGFELLQPGRG